MKSKSKIMLFIFLSILFLITILIAQDSKITWYSFNMGFGASSGSNTTVKSVAGQSFIGQTKNLTSQIESGFLVNANSQTDDVANEQNTINEIPTEFDLTQNYPNPFNPETTIRYQLTKETEVKIEIFNIEGRLIRTLINEKQLPGVHDIRWDGRNDQQETVASGIYLYRLQSKEFTKTRRLSLLK